MRSGEGHAEHRACNQGLSAGQFAPREAEICKLQVPLRTVSLIDEQILWLQVAVEYPPVMAETDACQKLEKVRLDLRRRHTVRGLVEMLLQVLITELEDEGELLIRVDDIMKPGQSATEAIPTAQSAVVPESDVESNVQCE